MPPGLLKSGIPDSVDMPAPVKITIFEHVSIKLLKFWISSLLIIFFIIEEVNKKPNSDK